MEIKIEKIWGLGVRLAVDSGYYNCRSIHPQKYHCIST